MVEEVVISQIPDPRIRGLCPIKQKDPAIPYPSIDRCISKKLKRNILLGSGYRAGSIVKYNDEIRTVRYVSSYPIRPACLNQHTINFVTVLDLGGIIVPHYDVELIKL